MDYEFNWQINIDASTRQSFESNLRDDVENHSFLRPCHSETVIVTLIRTDAFNEQIMGSMKCNCGKLIRNIDGKADGTKISYPD